MNSKKIDYNNSYKIIDNVILYSNDERKIWFRGIDYEEICKSNVW